MSLNTENRVLNKLGNIPLESITSEEVAKYLGPKLGFKFKPHVTGQDLAKSNTHEKFRSLLAEHPVVFDESHHFLLEIVRERTRIIDKRDEQLTKLMGLLTDEQLDSFCAENVITSPGVYVVSDSMTVIIV